MKTTIMTIQCITRPECLVTLLAGKWQVLQVGLYVPSKISSPLWCFTTSFASPHSVNSFCQFLNFLVHFTHVWDWNCSYWLYNLGIICFLLYFWRWFDKCIFSLGNIDKKIFQNSEFIVEIKIKKLWLKQS